MSGKAGKEETLRHPLGWLIIPSVFIADRLIKILVLQDLAAGQSVPVWPGVFHLTRVNNTGAAFGLWSGASTALAAFSAVSALLIAAHLAGFIGGRVRHPAAWALVAGGALGNLYDRLAFGYVVDYLDLRVWPVFNFADACISIGVAWIVLCFMRKPADGRTDAPGPV